MTPRELQRREIRRAAMRRVIQRRLERLCDEAGLTLEVWQRNTAIELQLIHMEDQLAVMQELGNAKMRDLARELARAFELSLGEAGRRLMKALHDPVKRPLMKTGPRP